MINISHKYSFYTLNVEIHTSLVIPITASELSLYHMDYAIPCDRHKTE